MNDEHDKTNQQPEIQLLYSLYDQLAHVPEGSEERNRIREKIDVIKDCLKARNELFRRLGYAVDIERALAIHTSQSVWQEQIHKQVRQLLEMDLTFCEVLRLGRLLAKEFHQIEVSQKNPGNGRTFEQNDYRS